MNDDRQCTNPDAPPLSRGPVLVAESNPAMRRLIADALKAAGITVIEATTHKAAMDRLWMDRSIKVIIADAVLPGGSGARLIDAARDALGPDVEGVILGAAANRGDQFTLDQQGPAGLVEIVGQRLDRVLADKIRSERLALPPANAPSSNPEPASE